MCRPATEYLAPLERRRFGYSDSINISSLRDCRSAQLTYSFVARTFKLHPGWAHTLPQVVLTFSFSGRHRWQIPARCPNVVI
jgi:hypothetical protein